jgi:outer membrane protein OmpA-like peptidoglycan-associated protein/tetratricopeptide (TPR) repeat protein
MYRHLFIIWSLTFLFVQSVISQQIYTKDNAPKSALKLYDKGDKLLKSGKPDVAEKCFIKALKKAPDFIDPLLSLGGIAYESGNFNKAIQYFQKAHNLDPAYNNKMLQALALSFENLNQLDSAVVYFQKYRNTLPKDQHEAIDKKVKQLEFIQYAVNNPVQIQPYKLPATINSPQHSEYLPSLTADGQTMFFTRVTNNQEDLYYSRKDQNGNWQEAKLMPNINTYENEGAHCISADGKTIVFTFCSDGKTGKPRGCNLYISYLRGDQWTKPQFMNVNSLAWDAQPNLSADGRTLIFASRRKGGIGGTDLWMSLQNNSGSWGAPKNLGEPVNTKGNEESPFQHGNNLFFKSDEHPGMGSFDLFKSSFDVEKGWSTPENLGYPINTENHEGAMVVSMDGTTAFYARGEGNVDYDRVQTDIYTFNLPENLILNPIGFVKFQVNDIKTGDPLGVKIKLQAIKASEILIDSFYTDQDGFVLIPLSIGKNYSFIINEEGYQLYSDRIELKESRTKENAFLKMIGLEPFVEETTASAPIVLKNVLFETGSYTMLKESFFELDQLSSLLKENPELKIEIRGHTDDVGSNEANLILSENRAKAVYDYLVSKGISTSRLSYKGFGENKPVASNETELGKSQNRRTEFVIIK